MKIRKVLTVGAAAGLLALGASAFTASNSMPAGITQGYGEQSISGVTAEQVNYNLSAQKDTIETIGLVLSGDTTALTIELAFNSDALSVCDGAGTYDEVAETTAYTCTSGQAVAGADKFVLVASS